MEPHGSGGEGSEHAQENGRCCHRAHRVARGSAGCRRTIDGRAGTIGDAFINGWLNACVHACRVALADNLANTGAETIADAFADAFADA
ncbi:hypothetical protein [Kribbella deserti]|uniref:Uncharacterized protein n=1 Tax=Kribbella deserti TaxID=1926257 RepID=A0ABV6QFQ0_9ACTN